MSSGIYRERDRCFVKSTRQAPVRLLIADVDGTLVSASRTISEPVRDAIKAARQFGVRIALGTGRPYFSTKRYIDELEIDGAHVFDSGASVMDTTNQKLVYHCEISKALALEFLTETQRANLHLEVYADSQYFIDAEREHSRIHAEIMRQAPVITRLLDVVEHRPVTKMEIVALDDLERSKAHALIARFADRLDSGSAGAPGTSADFINILAKGVSKGMGAAHVAAHYAIDAAHILAIGDGQNDESLLRFAGTGVAMGGAPNELKQIADWVAPPVEQDGLAYAIERFILTNDHLDR
jgi:Cof subfamily protein (haloacid dehalogenase superfamily)